MPNRPANHRRKSKPELDSRAIAEKVAERYDMLTELFESREHDGKSAVIYDVDCDEARVSPLNDELFKAIEGEGTPSMLENLRQMKKDGRNPIIAMTKRRLVLIEAPLVHAG